MKRGALEAALELALSAARAPHAELLAAFRDPDLACETKTDGTIVTAADRAAEARVRSVLRASPTFGGLEILGEEQGLERGAGEERWVVDPIDGTISFSRGIPAFGTLVALEEKASGRALVGVIHLPAMGETTWAARGLGAWCNGERIRASSRRELRQAVVSVPDPMVFRRAGFERAQHVLWEACEHLRGYSDCWGHALTARGAVDAVLEPWLAPWDVRATQVIVEEAGGLQLTRPSAGSDSGSVDALFGSPALVERIAELTGF